MRVVYIKNQIHWDGFIGTQLHSQFAQSYDWAEFQSEVVGKIWRVGVVENDEIIAAVKIVKKPLLAGWSYLYCDRGPIFKNNTWNKAAGDLLLLEINRLAVKEKSVFMRFDPVFDLVPSKLDLIKTIDIQPRKTAILDLSKSEEELLSAMHQKTRYNIRLAQKKGVTISIAGVERFEEFWKLMEETKERDDFNLHGKAYYKAMIEVPFIKLYFAEYQDKVIAVSIVAQYGDMTTYVHGGSSNVSRGVMAPFLLQWTAIQNAKAAGVSYYDFYGVDEKKWPGVTRFKMGFSAEVVEYSGTWDLVYNKMWYSAYKWLRIIRRKF